MRRKLAAGNWKMHGTGDDLPEIEALAARPEGAAELLVCPPATLIERAARAAHGSALRIGGQDCHEAELGAHTGCVSAPMLREAGASHVILGHSERRADCGETDAAVRAKVRAAQAAGLVAIVCVGETLEQREAGRALDVIGAQIEGSVPGGMSGGTLVVAYEPVWAIGSGKVPSPDETAEVHGFLRDRLKRRFGAAGGAVRLLYGGSVKPANAARIFAVPEVDGALVGGASLRAADFLPIVEALDAAAG